MHMHTEMVQTLPPMLRFSRDHLASSEVDQGMCVLKMRLLEVVELTVKMA